MKAKVAIKVRTLEKMMLKGLVLVKVEANVTLKVKMAIKVKILEELMVFLLARFMST